MQGDDEAEKVEYSSGGVLVRSVDGGKDRKVCLIRMSTRSGNPSWRLPKGCIEPDENSQQAALRETREETGCHGEIVTELDGIQYWYTHRNERGKHIRVKKKVDFYLMAYQGGQVSDHDHEVDEAGWFTFAKALKTISYDAECRVLQEAVHAWDAFYREPG